MAVFTIIFFVFFFLPSFKFYTTKAIKAVTGTLFSLYADLKAKSDKSGQDMEHLDFKIVVEPKDSQSFTIILVASSRQEKSAWTSDISQARQPTSRSPAARWIQPSCCRTRYYFPPILSVYLAICVPQCIDNIRCNGLMMNAFEDNSKVTVPQMIKWEICIPK